MILLLDCGNTLTKFAWLKDNTRSLAKVFSYNELDNLTAQLKHYPTKVFATNVASPEIKTKLELACTNTWGLSIKWCNYQDGRNFLHSNYANSLGSDRWLAALGLWQQINQDHEWLSGQPYILASFGTATTVDTLWLETQQDGSKQAKFIGGLILPGLEMMRTSLAQGTARLPRAHGKPDDFPLDTHTAINSGVIAAQSGAVSRQWQKAIALKQNPNPKIYVCGGAWQIIGEDIQAELNFSNKIAGLADPVCNYLDNPVLDGLALIASKN